MMFPTQGIINYYSQEICAFYICYFTILHAVGGHGNTSELTALIAYLRFVRNAHLFSLENGQQPLIGEPQTAVTVKLS
jgi:hypothetical protein